MNIAVTGAGGFIGSHVVELLLAAGHRVSCLILPGERHPESPGEALRYFEGSILEPDSLRPFLEGAEALLHLAGATRARTEAEYMRINVEGTRLLLDAALRFAAKPHVILMSSLAAVGPCTDCEAQDENAPFKPLTAYGRSKAALEELVRSYGERITWTIIRAPSVYGPKDRSFLQFFRLVSLGLRIVLEPQSVVSLLYVKTLARALVHCIRNASAYGNVFFIADEGVFDWDELQTYIEELLERKTIRVCLPAWVLAVTGTLAELATPFLRRPPLLSRDKLLEMKQRRWVVSTKKAERLLGFRPEISTRHALVETYDWYRRAQWI